METNRRRRDAAELSTVTRRVQANQRKNATNRNRLFLQNRNLDSNLAAATPRPKENRVNNNDKVASWRAKKNEAKIKEFVEKRSPFITGKKFFNKSQLDLVILVKSSVTK